MTTPAMTTVDKRRQQPSPSLGFSPMVTHQPPATFKVTMTTTTSRIIDEVQEYCTALVVAQYTNGGLGLKIIVFYV